MSAAAGILDDRFPYARTGSGPALIVLPGMVLDNGVPSAWTARSYGWGLHRLARVRTLHVVRRPRGLPEGAGAAELAAVYEPVLERFGPADVMGLSTGGVLAQHLAAARPELVRRLVLVVAGVRIAPPGRARLQRWQELAAAGEWRALRGDLTAVAVDGVRGAGLARLAVRGGPPEPVDATDFATTVSAVLAHDGSDALRRVAAPTLVVGGAVDPFFPEPVLRATASAVPGAELRVYPGGHGVPKQHGRRLQEDVVGFVTG